MATMKRRHIPLSEKQQDYAALSGDDYNGVDYNETEDIKEKNYKYQPQPQRPIVYSSNKVFALFLYIIQAFFLNVKFFNI